MSAASPKPTKAPKGEGKPEGTSKTNPKAVETKSVKPAGLSEQEKAVETLKGGGRFIGYIIWMMAFIPAGMMAYNIRLYAINTKARNPPGPAPEPGRRNKLGTGRPRRSTQPQAVVAAMVGPLGTPLLS